MKLILGMFLVAFMIYSCLNTSNANKPENHSKSVEDTTDLTFSQIEEEKNTEIDVSQTLDTIYLEEVGNYDVIILGAGDDPYFKNFLRIIQIYIEGHMLYVDSTYHGSINDHYIFAKSTNHEFISCDRDSVQIIRYTKSKDGADPVINVSVFLKHTDFETFSYEIPRILEDTVQIRFPEIDKTPINYCLYMHEYNRYLGLIRKNR